MLLLGACGSDSDNVVIPEGEPAAAADASGAEEGRILCAPIGSREFERVCSVDRVAGTEGAVLTVRQPDGGFHRLLVTSDGRGIVAADGAEPAKVTVLDAGEIEVAIGGARYRLPATGAPLAGS
ncbi:hypothetical protein GCM10009106_11140 [Sphingomonas japonica]